MGEVTDGAYEAIYVYSDWWMVIDRRGANRGTFGREVGMPGVGSPEMYCLGLSTSITRINIDMIPAKQICINNCTPTISCFMLRQ